MNAKITKLKEEREKNCSKISALQTRNKKIDADILSLENTDIIGMVRETGLSPEQLARLLQTMKHRSVRIPDFERTEGEIGEK